MSAYDALGQQVNVGDKIILSARNTRSPACIAIVEKITRTKSGRYRLHYRGTRTVVDYRNVKRTWEEKSSCYSDTTIIVSEIGTADELKETKRKLEMALAEIETLKKQTKEAKQFTESSLDI